MTEHRVFVYGTLMKGEQHHELMKQARFVGLGETLPQYELVQIDYFPAMLPQGATRIVGEVYEVDEATLSKLDELEEVPGFYVRERITLSDGSDAFVYLLPRERARGAAPIPSGYFRLRTAPPRRER